ncbi:MAG: hypothetical protein DRJ44_08015 [Thermoprotei archaeon]|nr:MAG: hypothetical protein DRJ44_08015 [Thermoprotei archaeon]
MLNFHIAFITYYRLLDEKFLRREILTGPGEGKIPLNAKIKLCSRNKCVSIECDVYLHVKGYSLARVTHVDIEEKILNEIVKPKKSQYCFYKVNDDSVCIYLRNPIYSKSLNILVRRIIIESKELAEALGESTRSWVFVGGKYGGIFLGFKKEQMEKLEQLARKYGVSPR